MRALLTPEIAPRMGIVLFRPGSELMPLFMQGRVLLEPEPERYSSFASGAVPAASQPLADDPAVQAVLLQARLLLKYLTSFWMKKRVTTLRHTAMVPVYGPSVVVPQWWMVSPSYRE